MFIPAHQGSIERITQFVNVCEAPSFQRQRTQLFPPGFYEIQPTDVLGNELRSDLGPRGQSQGGLTTVMRSQVIRNQQPVLCWEVCHDFAQQLNMTGAIPARTQQEGRLARRRLKGTQHPQGATASMVRLKGCAIQASLPLLSRTGLGKQRPQFVYTNHACVLWRRHIGRDYAPLFLRTLGRVSQHRGPSSVGASTGNPRSPSTTRWSNRRAAPHSALQMLSATAVGSTEQMDIPDYAVSAARNRSKHCGHSHHTLTHVQDEGDPPSLRRPLH